ncbi:MAG: DegV family protein [Clostridia bacterium]|nr:DegV family protein [Clostridia bacterium]
MKVIVSTDTSCMIKDGLFSDYEISVFPLNVVIDGEEYLDGVTINQEQLREQMRSGKVVKTSTPPLGIIQEYFENLLAKGYDHIIHFTISSKLSSMYSLFSNVAKQNFEGKVTVVDSYLLSVPMLNYVFFAYEQVKLNTPVKQIVSEIEKYKLLSNLVFIPENLTALKRGGRISPAIALIGNTLGIKPVIIFKDGALEKSEMTRRARKYFAEKIDEFSKEYPLTEYDYSVFSFDGEQRVLDDIYKHMQNVFPDYKFIRGYLPVNVCAHCGPGTIGISVTPKLNGKSITEYVNK